MLKLEGGFIANLGRVYGLYTLGFLAFVILMAILEASGVSNKVIGWLFVAFTVAIYALIGVLSRTMESANTTWQDGKYRLFTTAWQRQRTGCRVHLL